MRAQVADHVHVEGERVSRRVGRRRPVGDHDHRLAGVADERRVAAGEVEHLVALAGEAGEAVPHAGPGPAAQVHPGPAPAVDAVGRRPHAAVVGPEVRVADRGVVIVERGRGVGEGDEIFLHRLNVNGPGVPVAVIVWL